MSERVTQLYLEYSYGEPPAVRATQTYLEYSWTQAPAAIRATQLYLEYSYPVAGVVSTRARGFMFG